jgi:hypothetical protein
MKLSSLVQAADDPMVLLYVIKNLGGGVPNHACFASTVQTMREDAMRSLISGQWRVNRIRSRQLEKIEDQIMPALLKQQEQQLTVLLFRQASLNHFIDKLSREKEDTLRKHLKVEDPLLRLLALSAIGRRHLHLEQDLIEQLRDPNPTIQEATREALVYVTRGTDFGPIPGASQRTRERSIEKWQQWLALQRSTSQEKSATDAAIADGKRTKPGSLEIVPLLLVHDDKPALSSGAAKACDELVNGNSEEQRSMLARLRHAKDSESTEALALAIPKLSGDIQQQARDALTERLTRLPSAELIDKLQDDNPEMRCAAALAVGRKIAKERIADLVQLLEDPEMAVVQSARVALTELSGEDFGPTSDADRRGRGDAVAAWRKWWKERHDKQK